MKTNLAVLFGGNSVEHEISIISALQAIENIDKQLYNVIPIYITKQLKMYTDNSFTTVDPFLEFDSKKYPEVTFQKRDSKVYVTSVSGLFKKVNLEVDIAFPIVHGTGVEDGSLQGYLTMFNLPIVGPTVLSGAVGQDKAVMKDILKARNISQTKYVVVTKVDDIPTNIKQIEQQLPYPVILKPASLGSSVGIEVCSDQASLTTALENCYSFDNKIVVEEALTNFEEYNISVLGEIFDFELSVIEHVVKTDEFLSYDQKYVAGSKKGTSKQGGMASLSREVPANIPSQIAEEIQELARQSYVALNCNGLVRFDILIDSNSRVYINEVNSIPGSLAYYLWEATGYTYTQQLTKMIEIAVNSHFRNQKLVQSFDTNVLTLQKGSKC